MNTSPFSFIGELSEEPAFVTGSSGQPVCRLRVRQNFGRFRDHASGEWIDRIDELSVRIVGELAERLRVEGDLAKGDLVFVTVDHLQAASQGAAGRPCSDEFVIEDRGSVQVLNK